MYNGCIESITNPIVLSAWTAFTTGPLNHCQNILIFPSPYNVCVQSHFWMETLAALKAWSHSICCIQFYTAIILYIIQRRLIESVSRSFSIKIHFSLPSASPAPCTLTEASSAQPISLCKVEVDTGSRGQSSPPHSEHSPGPTRHPSPPRTASPKQSSIITRQHEWVPRVCVRLCACTCIWACDMNRNCINNARLVWLIAFSPKFVIFLPSFCRAGHPTLEGSSALFLNGLCCWPGCDAVFEEFPSFLK